MNKQKTKIVGYRVKKIHVKSLNEHVRKFLLSKNYKLYAKRKQGNKKTIQRRGHSHKNIKEGDAKIKGRTERVKQHFS